MVFISCYYFLDVVIVFNFREDHAHIVSLAFLQTNLWVFFGEFFHLFVWV